MHRDTTWGATKHTDARVPPRIGWTGLGEPGYQNCGSSPGNSHVEPWLYYRLGWQSIPNLQPLPVMLESTILSSLSPSSQYLKTFLMVSQIGKLSGIQLGWATEQNGLGREWWSRGLPVTGSPALQPNTAPWENLVHFPQGSSTHSPGPDILGGNGQHTSLYRIPSEHPVFHG